MSNMKSTTAPIEKPTVNLVALAWIVILVGFETPAIIFHFFVPVGASEPYVPVWMRMAQLVFYAGFWLTARFFSSLKPLSGFALALFALVLGTGFIQPAILHSSIFVNWLNEASWGMKQIGITGLKLITVGLMALTLIGSGIGRRELFLSRGKPRALAMPTPFLPALRESKPWDIVVRNFLPFYVGGMLIVLWLQIRPDATQFTRILIFLPAIILAAAINAFAEEFEARSMLLSRLEPVIRVGQAVMMTSVFFGLWHYGPANNPNGPFGALLAGYLGWVAAKSMIETRGMVWAFLLHFLVDIVILTFSAMAVV